MQNYVNSNGSAAPPRSIQNNSIQYANHQYINYSVYGSVQYCQNAPPPLPHNNTNGHCLMPPYSRTSSSTGGVVLASPTMASPYMMTAAPFCPTNHQKIFFQPPPSNLQHTQPSTPFSMPSSLQSPYFAHQSQNYSNSNRSG